MTTSKLTLVTCIVWYLCVLVMTVYLVLVMRDPGNQVTTVVCSYVDNDRTLRHKDKIYREDDNYYE